MSIEDNKAVVRRFVEEVWQKGNLDIADELLTPDFIEHAAPKDFPTGPEGFKQFAALFHQAFPDFHVTMEDLFGEGDRVAMRGTARGTQHGQLRHRHGQHAPTGKQGTFTGIVIYRLEGGKIAEAWLTIDELDLLHQLGVITVHEHAKDR